MRLSDQLRESRPGNLAYLAAWYQPVLQALGAVAAGVLLAAAFAPCSWSLVAWIGLIPLLVLTIRQPSGSAWRLGYLFGLGHFTASFYWLWPVFFLAPVGIALLCAVFPACWVWLMNALWFNLHYGPAEDLAPQANPAFRAPERLSPFGASCFTLSAAIAWCAFEWCRSWLFSGFPWNQLGISQWQQPLLLPLTRFVGVYGLSFVLVLSNSTFFLLLIKMKKWNREGKKTVLSRQAIVAVISIWLLVLALAIAPGLFSPSLPVATKQVHIAAVQGNIAQCRFASLEQAFTVLDVYLRLSREAAASKPPPDLICWPETAVPLLLCNEPKALAAVTALCRETNIPLLAGTIDYRVAPGATDSFSQRESDVKVFNSIICFSPSVPPRGIYDKMHRVPFGEYVPFNKLLPHLADWIGMGEDLSPGRAFGCFSFTPHAATEARIGMNICYEDIFPDISRNQVLRGANMLLTVTNDAWFAETAGAAQHLAHAALRAVENNRPLLRVGNNSHTALILPDGRVQHLLADPVSGNPFYRGWRVYSIPIAAAPSLTFYTRFGDLFAQTCAFATVLIAAWCAYRFLHRKRRLLLLVCPDFDEGM